MQSPIILSEIIRAQENGSQKQISLPGLLLKDGHFVQCIKCKSVRCAINIKQAIASHACDLHHQQNCTIANLQNQQSVMGWWVRIPKMCLYSWFCKQWRSEFLSTEMIKLVLFTLDKTRSENSWDATRLSYVLAHTANALDTPFSQVWARRSRRNRRMTPLLVCVHCAPRCGT